MGLQFCRVIRQSKVAEGIWLLEFESEAIARSCRPGQFVHVRIQEWLQPFWRRPFSIHGVDLKAGTVRLLYRIIGTGTEILSSKKPGHVLDVLGPLGNGFNTDFLQPRGLIVAGGVGSADLFFLVQRFIEKGKSVIFLWGIRKKTELFEINWLEKLGVDVRIATEDGSAGFRGMVTDLLEITLREDKELAVNAVGSVCGPKGMIHRVQSIVNKTEMTWQASLEEKMACGLNVCKGCAVRMKAGGYAMVCSDGPVFNLREVIIED